MPILYILLLAGQVILLIFAIRRKSIAYWMATWITEALSAALAWGLGVYYDGLPGYGMMPGLTYFAHTLYSMAAAVAYGCLLLVSLLLGLWQYLKKK